MQQTSIYIQFLGATETVTGSRTLVQIDDFKILIDCGLFQGPKEVRERNWVEFTKASDVDAVVLTHAHIDHSGYLPKFVKEGFAGKVYCSSGTKDLCEVLLRDAAHIQEEDARFANKAGYSRHDPALPLYDKDDAESAIRLLHSVESGNWIEIHPKVQLKLLRSGHILGSRFVQLRIALDEQKSEIITFSGDIGNGRSNIIKDPVEIHESDYLVLESTYGDRRQTRLDPSLSIEHIVKTVIKREGTVVIPSFAVGRTQELLFILNKLEREQRIPSVPVYVDSPMAIEATDIYLRNCDELKLQLEDGKFVTPISPQNFQVVRDSEKSMLLCMDDQPKIVISAAGMLSGGRILHHLKARLPDKKNGVIFVGYQASGTKGLLLKNGLPEIKIHRQLISVEAEIFVVDGLSAHGDCEDIMNWLAQFKKIPKTIFLNHGEENALRSLKYMIHSHHECEIVIPRYNNKFKLN